MPWTPGQRKAARALEAPYDDVPYHLHEPLWRWIKDELTVGSYVNDERLRAVCMDLRQPPLSLRDLEAMCHSDLDFMLDLVEALLERGADWDRAVDTVALSALLADANSAYQVKESEDGLEQRVAPGVKELVQEAINDASGSAGDHLANAWNAAYGRKSDPTKAYGEAIKAAEAALAKRVSPQNSKQTLGTMIRDVAAKPAKWKFAIAGNTVDGVDTVLAMMQLLWEGQTSRHGGTTPTRLETADEARAAVHLAAALVQFGVSGALDIA